jgi:hypothetical protein
MKNALAVKRAVKRDDARLNGRREKRGKTLDEEI